MRTIFFHIKVPSAGSSIFAGLQIAVVLGLIGAVVAEFIAAKMGLGTMSREPTGRIRFFLSANIGDTFLERSTVLT